MLCVKYFSGNRHEVHVQLQNKKQEAFSLTQILIWIPVMSDPEIFVFCEGTWHASVEMTVIMP